MPLLAFYDGFTRELCDVANNNVWYTEYCQKNDIGRYSRALYPAVEQRLTLARSYILEIPTLPQSVAIDGRDVRA
jgi:hypothetical protein